MTSWGFNPILDSYVVVTTVALGLLMLLLLGPAFGNLVRRQRLLLSALRAISILLLILAMLRPTIVNTAKRPQSATLVILADQSRSMQVPDMPGGVSRWKAQRTTLKKAAPVLSELAEMIDVEIYSFDANANELNLTDGKISLPSLPTGASSDIGSSLDDVLQQSTGKRLAGVILLSDGAQRAIAPRVESHQVARELSRLEYPLYTVSYGVDIEKSRARDVAVENLQDHYTVFVKNELVIRSLLKVRGYVNRKIPVELVIEDALGNQTVTDTQQLTAAEEQQQVEIKMSYIPEQTGQYRMILRAAEQAGELVTQNNQLSAFLTVLEGGLKVFYAEGEPRLERKYLFQSLDFSADIQLDDKWLDHRLRDSWPVDMQRELANPEYDVFVLGDLDSEALYLRGKNENNLRILQKAVSDGKGLMMLGGYHSFGPGGYFGTPLADVLPITMDRFSRQRFDSPFREDLHLQKPITLLPTEEHFITHLAAGNDNLARWKRLPPLRGANRFSGIKNNTKVLLKSSDGEPILIAGRYGLGRVLAFAGDETWRWWTAGHQAEHKRFWRQAILWLARKDQATRENIWIELPQRRFPVSSSVRFSVGAKTTAGDEIENVELNVSVVLPDDSRHPVSVSTRDGIRQGIFSSTQKTGQYTIEVSASQGGAEIGKTQAKFLINDEDLELTNPAADPAHLSMLSEMTQEFGGQRIAPEELVPLLEKIKDNPQQWEVEEISRRQLGDHATDAWVFFISFVGLMVTEWFFRKKWGLV